MKNQNKLRVLHSFPHRLGMARICTTAWYEIDSVAQNGNNVLVLSGDVVRPFKKNVSVKKTLSIGKIRVPAKVFGVQMICKLHDKIVAKKIPKYADKIDIIHAWPLAALQTMKVARKYNIPVALERCNAHTRFAYTVVRDEGQKIGVTLPKGHEHAFNTKLLEHEEKEYELADGILCPSDFVVKTFINYGFPKDKLVRFIYGVDEKKFYPDYSHKNEKNEGLKMLYVGVAAVRKGLHYALKAWLNSSASEKGTFMIAGDFLPDYKEKLMPMLSHKSVQVLGHRNDIPELMRKCDVFILPSIEEGFGLVCTEAMVSGCIPLVSDACTDLCRDNENALVHNVGDVEAIVKHIEMLNADRQMLTRLRNAGIDATPQVTWKAAGLSIANAYREIIDKYNE